MLPTREQVLAKAKTELESPVAIEAFWDGDTDGWFVNLTAVVETDGHYRDHGLWTLSDGGDIRLFNAAVPPWPESVRAQEVGKELAAHFGVPFYFASPKHPEESCPRWWEQDQGYPCRRCGILLLQRDPCPWRGVCHWCHIVERRESQEATWTLEQRAGPRCHICGNPAKEIADSHAMCPGCLDRYETYICSRCGVSTLILKTKHHTDLCGHCDICTRLALVPEEHREAIRTAQAEGGELNALKLARNLLGLGRYDALAAVRELCGRSGSR